MYFLIYVSQSKDLMSPSALEDILTVSRTHNVANGLSGLLIYRLDAENGRGHFIQLLEGEKDAVRETYARIAKDPRHHTKIILEEGETPDRHFPTWSMGFKNADAADLAGVPGFADLGEATFEASVKEGKLDGALDLLKSFYDADD